MVHIDLLPTLRNAPRLSADSCGLVTALRGPGEAVVMAALPPPSPRAPNPREKGAARVLIRSVIQIS